MTTFSRVQPGVPTGGQFAPTTHAEADVELTLDSLGVDEPNWGSTTVQVGSRTPWGPADHVEVTAPGIAQVGTPGHGGIKLSPERNAEIPPALRNKSGWYEEDCEAHIVAMHHPEAFPNYMGGDLDAIRADGENGVKNWFPDKYEQATGQTVTAEESSERRRQMEQADAAAFRAAHSSEFVSTGWGNDSNGDWVPEGYTTLTAKIDDTGETREFLVPHADGVADHTLRKNVVIDPNRHVDITGISGLGNPAHPAEGPRLTGDQLGVDMDNLTQAQRSRAYEELGKRWRFPNDDGTETVETLGEHLGRVGVVGKKQIGDQGYYVEYGGSRVQKVSKATFSALAGVPDTNTDLERLSIAHSAASKRLETARGSYDPAKVAKARAAAETARAAYDAARAADDATKVPWDQRQQMRKDALNDLLAARGIELA